MALMNNIDWLRQARREHFALGAFNANTLEQVQAITAAADEEGAPAIIQVSHRALLYLGRGSSSLGLRYMAATSRVAVEAARAPVGLHLDHATESEIILAAGLGFNSVMLERADLPFQTYLEKTRDLAVQMHDLGISIEAEVGEVPRLGNEGRYSPDEPTDPDLAAEFVERTGIDSLAVSIGSVHAVTHKERQLDFDRLARIAAAVAIPLVLHGSSGVTDASISRGIELGLCKVNVATQLNQAFIGAVRARLTENPQEVDPRPCLNSGREAMVARVRERIRLFGTPGKNHPARR